jgi:hypothetical protein
MNAEGGFCVEWDGLFVTVIFSVQFIYEINWSIDVPCLDSTDFVSKNVAIRTQIHYRLVRLGYLAFTQATRVQIPVMEFFFFCHLFWPRAVYLGMFNSIVLLQPNPSICSTTGHNLRPANITKCRDRQQVSSARFRLLHCNVCF